MNNRREQVMVGSFVLIVSAVLIAVVLSVSGAFGQSGVKHLTYFKYAAGLTSEAPVRFGGLLAGKVERVRVDPADSTLIEIEFTVHPEIPVKTDSIAKITSLGALGESYLEISTGTKDSAAAPPGSVIRSKEMAALADLGDMMAGLMPSAQELIKNLNSRVSELQTTIANVNALTGESNRKNINASLENLNAMLAESRPKIAAVLANVNTATDKLTPIMANIQTATERVSPMLDDLNTTIKQANKALTNIDAILTENRPDIRASLEDTRKTINTANQLVVLLKNTMERNTGNLDDTLLNVREATSNMKEMTDTLKRKPSVLIRGETGKDRVPGATK